MKSNLQSFFFVALLPAVLLVAWCLAGVPIHLDTLLLASIGDKSISGGAYISDFIDISPPMGFWYYAPIIPLSNITGIGLESTTWLYLALIPVIPSLLILNTTRMQGELNIGYLYLISLLIVTFHNLSEAMNKDVVALLLMSPWLVAFVVSKPETVQLRLLAAVGMIAKPYFILLPIVISIVHLYKNRTFRGFLSYNIPFGVVGVLYLFVVYQLHPEFFEVFPELLQMYSGRMSVQFNLFRLFEMLALFLAVLIIPYYSSNLGSVSKRSLLVSMVFLAIGLLQFKGLRYHYFGCAVFFGVLVLNLLFENDGKKILKAIAVLVLSYCSVTLMLSNNMSQTIQYSQYKSTLDNMTHKGQALLLTCPNGFELHLPYFTGLKFDLVLHSAWFTCKGMGNADESSINTYVDIALKRIKEGKIDFIVRTIRNDGNGQSVLDSAFNEIENSVGLTQIDTYHLTNKTLIIYALKEKI